MDRIAVAVLAGDPVTLEGTVARLPAFPGVDLCVGQRLAHAQVLLVIAGDVNDDLLSKVERLVRQVDNEALSVVLVADEIGEQQVLRAIGFGLVALLSRQEAGFDQVVQAIVAAAGGRAILPAEVARIMIEQMKTVQNRVLAPRGLTANGLAVREVEVLRLLSDGLDTGEIAEHLNYSPRTVKNILSGVMNRFNLRNRTHAVAYALRSGVL